MKYTEEQLKKQFARCALGECFKYNNGKCNAIYKDDNGVLWCLKPLRYTRVVEVIKPPVEYHIKPEPPPSYKQRVVHSRLAWLTKADVENLCKKYKISAISTIIEVALLYLIKKNPDPKELHKIWKEAKRKAGK